MSGNAFPETLSTLTPLVKVPIGDKLQAFNTHQRGPCAFFEMQFYRCMEAFGARLGRKYCDLEHRDFRECITQDKQLKRALAIRAERRRQFLSGERSLFEENHPQMGIAEGDFFDDTYVHNNRV